MRTNSEPESEKTGHGAATAAAARRFGVLAILAFLVGCSYAPGEVANPLTRKFTWTSFLGADDLRAGCAPGAPDRFRLIYNGNWKEQVRIYELGFAAPHRLDQRVIGPGQLQTITLDDPLSPWRGATASVTLSARDYEELVHDLEASGADASPATTLTLNSTDFYWVAASCHAGAFHLTAWLYPSDGFSRAAFPQRLLALDKTGVPLNPPRHWTDEASAPLGTADNPARGSRTATAWSVGIVQNHLLDQAVF